MKKVLIKTGGRAAEDQESLAALAREMKKLSGEYQFILVHGGGAVVSAIQKTYGMEPLFIDGKRITSPKEMDLVDMGLSGQMNTYLVRLFNQQGLSAVGLSGADGALFVSKSVGDFEGKENRTGKVVQVDLKLVETLEAAGFLPVICSVSVDAQGRGININADEAALALAKAWRAQDLLFISDIPGIMENREVHNHLNESQSRELINKGVIQGGMIPKVESSLKALHHGVGKVIIGQYGEEGQLEALLSHKQGSSLSL